MVQRPGLLPQFWTARKGQPSSKAPCGTSQSLCYDPITVQWFTLPNPVSFMFQQMRFWDHFPRDFLSLKRILIPNSSQIKNKFFLTWLCLCKLCLSLWCTPVLMIAPCCLSTLEMEVPSFMLTLCWTSLALWSYFSNWKSESPLWQSIEQYSVWNGSSREMHGSIFH